MTTAKADKPAQVPPLPTGGALIVLCSNSKTKVKEYNHYLGYGAVVVNLDDSRLRSWMQQGAKKRIADGCRDVDAKQKSGELSPEQARAEKERITKRYSVFDDKGRYISPVEDGDSAAENVTRKVMQVRDLLLASGQDEAQMNKIRLVGDDTEFEVKGLKWAQAEAHDVAKHVFEDHPYTEQQKNELAKRIESQPFPGVHLAPYRHMIEEEIAHKRASTVKALKNRTDFPVDVMAELFTRMDQKIAQTPGAKGREVSYRSTIAYAALNDPVGNGRETIHLMTGETKGKFPPNLEALGLKTTQPEKHASFLIVPEGESRVIGQSPELNTKHHPRNHAIERLIDLAVPDDKRKAIMRSVLHRPMPSSGHDGPG